MNHPNHFGIIFKFYLFYPSFDVEFMIDFLVINRNDITAKTINHPEKPNNENITSFCISVLKETYFIEIKRSPTTRSTSDVITKHKGMKLK